MGQKQKKEMGRSHTTWFQSIQCETWPELLWNISLELIHIQGGTQPDVLIQKSQVLQLSYMCPFLFSFIRILEDTVTK